MSRVSLQFRHLVVLALAPLTLALLAVSPVAKPVTKPTAKAPAKSALAPPAAGKPAAAKRSLIWEAWYTIELEKKHPYGAYHDRFERENGLIFFQNHFTKLEEGYFNEEALGAVSKDDDTLTPEMYNFRSNYRATEIQIDASFKEGIFTAKASRGSESFPLIRKSIAARTFLSSFFPMYIQKNWNKFKLKEHHSFHAIAEDQLENHLPTLSGILRLESDDEFSKKTGTRKFVVDYKDMKSIWYFESTGKPHRIEMPESNIVIEKVPESIAKNYLNKSEPIGKTEKE